MRGVTLALVPGSRSNGLGKTAVAWPQESWRSRTAASRASIILGPSKRRFVIKKIRFFPIFAKIVHANSLLRAEFFPFSEDTTHQLPLGSAGGWVSGRLFAIAQRHAHEHLVFGRRQKLPELLIVTWSRTSGSASSAGSRSPPSSPPCCLRRLRLTR